MAAIWPSLKTASGDVGGCGGATGTRERSTASSAVSNSSTDISTWATVAFAGCAPTSASFGVSTGGATVHSAGNRKATTSKAECFFSDGSIIQAANTRAEHSAPAVTAPINANLIMPNEPTT